MKRKRMFALALTSLFILTACTPANKEDGEQGADNREVSTATADPMIYKRYYSGELTTLNYLIEGSANNAEAYANLIDTLIEYDRYGAVQPCLAENWETSEDGLEWTFYLRDGLTWVNHLGEVVGDVTSADWVASAEYSLNPENSGGGVNTNMKDHILHAEAYTYGELDDFSQVGVTAVNEKTLRFTLVSPTPYFLDLLTSYSFIPAYAPLLAEMGKSYGTNKESIVFNGAYILETWQPQEKQYFVKNEHYWDSENVFIDVIDRTYNAEAGSIAPEAFMRGETDFATINSELLDEYLADPIKSEYLVGERPNNQYSYFFGFNFDPNFEDIYEPANWDLAANNLAFRKSIFHALNRKAALSAVEPFNPDGLLSNTITPKDFAHVNGEDYAEMGGLDAFTNKDSMDETLAITYKEKAMEELAAKGATFPIKMLLKYNPNVAGWEQECVLIEQQIENLLGDEYIDIMVVTGPSEGFLDTVRRSGNYGFLKMNRGAGHTDPTTWMWTFLADNSYMFNDKASDPTTLQITADFTALIEEAAEISKDPNHDPRDRFLVLAQAEHLLIENALVIPYSISQVGYVLNKLNVFEGPYAPFGITRNKYKGMKIIDEAINLETFRANYEIWQEERQKALENALYN